MLYRFLSVSIIASIKLTSLWVVGALCNHELLPSSGIEGKHYEIYKRYLDNINFIKPLSTNNCVYKVKYQGEISILRILYNRKTYIRELNISSKLASLQDNIKKYDITIVLSCNKALQRRRVLKRQGWNEERYEKTLKEQIPDYVKQRLADIIIKSDRGKRYLYEEIIKIIKEVKNKKNRKIQEILKEF